MRSAAPTVLLPRFLAIVLMLACLGQGGAAGTAADTEITNQASATFDDSAGIAQTTTSNQVVTVVQQVYEISITPNGTLASPGQVKAGVAGASHDFVYFLTNTGNGSDTITLATVQDAGDDFDFTSLDLYRDVNCDSLLDGGDTLMAGSLTLASDEQACLLLRAVVPATATNDQGGNIDLQGTSSGPAGSPTTDTENWARAEVTTAASLNAVLSANPAGTVNGGDAIAYTVSGSNSGGSAAYGVSTTTYTGTGGETGIVVVDAIPANTTYVAGSLSGSEGSGSFTVRPIYHDGTSWSTTEPAAASVTQVGMVIVRSGGSAFFPVGTTYQMSFAVEVNGGLPGGTQIANSGASVTYGTSSNTSTTATSNPVTNTVATIDSVKVGPGDDPSAAGPDTTYAFLGWTIQTDFANDSQLVTTPVYTGQTVLFKNTLLNDGNVSDSFALSLGGAPAGWSCEVRQVDGSAPIINPVGPLAMNAVYDFSVACTIPDANSSASATPTNLTVTATGQSGGQSDATTDIVPSVGAGYGVTLTSGGAAAIATQALDPGQSFTFPLEVANAGQHDESFDLAVTAPTDWTLDVYNDSDCNGSADDANPVTSTGTLAVGDPAACFVAAGSVPSGEASGLAYTIEVSAASAGDPTGATDAVSGDFTVNTIASLDLSPDRSGSVTTPGTVNYDFTLTNTGNTSATVDLTFDAGAYGWTYELSADDGTSYSASILDMTVAAGASVTILARVAVPLGEPVNRVELMNLMASGTFLEPDGATTTTVSDVATITTTVVGGDLELTNSGRTCADAACATVVDGTGATTVPGQYIEYTLQGSNTGTADISNIVIVQTVPTYTELVALSASTSVAGASILYSTDEVTWHSDPGTLPTVGPGGTVYVALDSDGSGAVTTDDALPPADTVTVVMTVMVQ